MALTDYSKETREEPGYMSFLKQKQKHKIQVVGTAKDYG